VFDVVEVVKGECTLSAEDGRERGEHILFLAWGQAGPSIERSAVVRDLAGRFALT
jgi:hypothetical protein